MSEYKPVTADDVVAPIADNSVDEDATRRAGKAGVKDVAFVNYAGAMDNYQRRSDVETLASRRARENGASFSDTDFRRTTAGIGENDTVVTSEKTKNK